MVRLKFWGMELSIIRVLIVFLPQVHMPYLEAVTPWMKKSLSVDEDYSVYNKALRAYILVSIQKVDG